MDARRRVYRIRFLILVFFIATTVFAQEREAGAGSTVSVSLTPEVPVARNPFTLTFLIDHSVVEEVSVVAPPFSAPVSLSRFARTPRATGTGIKTAIEFTLISNIAGRILLDPFVVITPHGTVDTGPLVITIQEEGVIQNLISVPLVWEGVPQQLAAGERIAFTLRSYPLHLQDTNFANILLQLPSGFFMPEVPRGVILSQSAVSSQERENGIVLRLSLIPLEAGYFYLPTRIILHENIRFEIPALRVRIMERVR